MVKAWKPQKLRLIVVLSSFFLIGTLFQYVNFPRNSIQIPNIASSTITCDVRYGDTYAADLISSINWTVTGYLDLRYFLRDNGQTKFFDTITTNETLKIRQNIESGDGWHALSIHIYDKATLVNETFVVIQIISNQPIYTDLSFWFAIVAGIAAVGVVGDVIMWRRIKKSQSRSWESDFHSQKYPSLMLGSDLIQSRNETQERALTYVSTSRVKKVWWVDVDRKVILYTRKYRMSEGNKAREAKLDIQVLKFLIQNQLEYVNARNPMFITVPALSHQERLVLVNPTRSHFLILLLRGRVSRTYYRWLEGASQKIANTIAITPYICEQDFFKILETQLIISRSLLYVEPETETALILKTSNLPGLISDPLISIDARMLTPSECSWVVSEIHEHEMRKTPDPLLDEEEIL